MGILKDIREEIRLTREQIEASREEIQRSRDAYADQREFLRGLVRRSELSQQRMLSKSDEQSEVLVALQGEIADQREQIQAETQAIYSVLDRLN